MDIDDVNAYFIRTSLWPAILFTVLTMVIGIVGNTLVLVIYRKDYHKSVTWTFIYFLSILDIGTCLISMPSELIILVNLMSFPSWPWCKISRYLSFIFHGSSCVILMAIAFNRYNRVCRGTNHWLNLKRAKIINFGIVAFACVIDIPSLILYGEAKVFLEIEGDTVKIMNKEESFRYYKALQALKSGSNSTTVSNTSLPEVLVGRLCLIQNEYYESILTPIFYAIQFVMYIILVVLVCYFYTKVIRKMVGYRTKQEKLFKLQFPNPKKKISADETSNNHLSEDVRSDSIGRDITSDPLSQGGALQKPEIKTTEPTTTNLPEDTCYGQGEKNHESNHAAPISVTAPIDDLKTRPEITSLASHAKHFDSNGLNGECNPLQSNKLLSRRIKSVDALSKSYTQIPGLVIPSNNEPQVEQNSKSPLFLHASKTHKKRGQYESDRRNNGKCNSDEQILIKALETKDDLYLHKQQQVAGCMSKSLEVLSQNCFDPLNVNEKSMTLNRRSPKGSQQCILPISGLSVKSVTAYDSIDANGETANDTPNSETELPENASRDVNDETNSDKEATDNASNSDSSSNTSEEKEREQPLKRSMKRRLLNQASVTFSLQEDSHDANNMATKRSPARSRVIDSVSPLVDTPEGEIISPPIRTNRSDSLFSPSPRTASYSRRRRMSVKPIKALRTSSMLLSISLAFVLSFLPFWIIVLWRSVAGADFVASIGPTGFGLVSVFIRSSLVSNAVNPIVYGLLNSQFRKRCKAIIWRR